MADKITVKVRHTNKISKIIAIGSGKGGVGKSMVAANLAMAMSKQGKKVGLIDADIYGPTQPTMFGCNKTMAQINKENKIIPLESHGVKFISISTIIDCSKPLILRAPIVTKIIHELLNNVHWDVLDYLLIDLPPGTGDIQLTIAQNAKLDGSIIVTTPQEISINIAKKGLAMFQKVNIPIIGIIENMSGFKCSHCGEISNIFTIGNINNLKQQDNITIPVLAKIPLHKDISESGDNGIPVPIDSKSNIEKLFFEVVQRCDFFIKDINNNQSEKLKPDLFEIQNGNLYLSWTKKNISGILNAYSLRLLCKCALCISESTGVSLIQENLIPDEISIVKIEEIGQYGLKVIFSDRHNTGIYTFERLIAACKKL